VKTIPLGKIANVATGGTPIRDTPEYWGGSIPWVGTGQIDFNIIQSPSDYLTPRGLAASAAKLLPKGTLLMAMYGQGATRGKVGILGFDAATNQACAAITPKDGLIESEFLFHVLEAGYTRIRRLSNIGGQDNLNTTLIREIPVPVLTKSERETVVAAAREWTEGIQKTSGLLDALERRKQGLMQQLLTGRRRLKGFKGKWKASPLRKMFEPVTRTAEGDLPILTISAGRGFLTQQERFNRVVAGRNIAGYTALHEGEFAYNKGNSKSYDCGCFYVLKGYPVAAVPNVYITFRAKEALCDDFYGFYFEADMLGRQLCRIINSGVRNDGLLNLSSRDFFNMHIPVPHLEEQRAIADVLSDASQEIAVLKKQLNVLREQKRALMQKLLSGEWRLPESPSQGKSSSKKGLQPTTTVRKQLSKK
jgi:type I restriction enzyme S subunit